MSFSPEELEQHCLRMLGDRRINNKIVVLCEGKSKDIHGIRSPQAYKKIETLPDANFYKKCVPKTWIGKPRPQFFNCGDRSQVINAYFLLLKLHEQNVNQSYLNKSKLFALIDLDIQLKTINNYIFPDTEQIFNNLYHQAQVIPNQAAKHRIWITGLIHKEAYFISPNIQELFNYSSLAPQYDDNPVELNHIYQKMSDEIINDLDLEKNFERVINRIDYCQDINCCDRDQLTRTWNQIFNNNLEETRKSELIIALLTIRKAKPYWEQVKPDNNWTKSPVRFREQLSLSIGDFYSRQDWNNPENHFAYFFKTLYQFA